MTAQVPSAKDLPQDQAIGLLSGASAWLTKKVPGLGQAFVADGPHGVRARPDGVTDLGISGALPATCFPTAVTLASTWDPDLLTRIGTALGQEAKQLGVDVILGPGMNLKRHPLCGRNFEYYSEDPYLTGIMATAITKGIQGEGVGTSVKHFAVNNQETNRFVVDAVVDLRTLHELYLKGFEMTVRGARPWTVMAAYNLVNGTHCTENQYLLTKTLRQEWGFDGLVMSDWGAVADRVAGIKAGMDLEMPGSQGLWDAEVARTLESGALTRAEMDKCVQRVLDLIAKSPKLQPSPREIPAEMIDAHNALAREAAAAGSVLLKNDGALPLAPGGKIAVIGAFAKEPRYQGFGSSFVNPTRLTSAVDALKARGVEFDYTPGYEPLKSADDAAALTAAIVAARKADVAVVFAGLPPFIESESYDRDNLSLPAQHDALITAVASANPNTVVVLFNGAPVVMPWLDSVRAVLDVYLGGQAGGAAIVDMLYGDANPGGRLAETFPRRLADIPANANFPGSPHRVVYGEQLMVGYRYHVTSGVVPLYPFGYGLSYTSFKWSDASVDRENLEISALPEGAGTLDAACEVSVTVTNTGARAGSEVVQVYLSDRTGALPRPRRELAGFAKVALAPGESRRVTVPVPAAAFAVWVSEGASGKASAAGTSDTASGWQVPSGEFELEVARNSWDVVATLPVIVAGTLPAGAEEPHMSDIWQVEVEAATKGVSTTAKQIARSAELGLAAERPARPFTRDSTVGELEQTLIGRKLGAIIRKGAFPDEGDELTAYMVSRQTSELPIRAGAMFSEGRLSLKLVDALLAAMNGKPHAVLPAMFRK